jgi:hypothetical protein
MTKKRFEGIVSGFYFKPLTEKQIAMEVKVPGKGLVKINADKTHNMSIKGDDGVFYGWGSVKFRDNDPIVFRRDCGEGWQEIYDGAKVFFFYKETVNGEYTNRNVDKATFQLLENGPKPEKMFIWNASASASANASASVNNSQSVAAKTPFDPKGPAKGNAHNNSLILVNYDLSNPELIDILAIRVYQINNRIQANTGINGYAVGMAVNNACRITMNIEKVEAMAIHLLSTHIKTIEQYVDKGVVPPHVNTYLEAVNIPAVNIPAASVPSVSTPAVDLIKESQNLPEEDDCPF